MRASGDGAISTLADRQWLRWAITTDDAQAYWLDVGDGSVWRSSFDGFSAARIATSPAYPVAVVVDDRSVYWTDSRANAIFRSPR